jgi:hypothetical protein
MLTFHRAWATPYAEPNSSLNPSFLLGGAAIHDTGIHIIMKNPPIDTVTCELKFSELEIQDHNKAFFDDQTKGYLRVPLAVLSIYVQ